ncbi:hypothetical protein L2E82_05778 [Cichorium intybus]|uniref:Uncharacterized protein n=1 Tax=Cichorium intybus TaxID=13427 RepID=A0ACB9H8N5_CICIN|nr:hypothetical protein L2E82_05778 [Cichorium intybus]
MVKKKERSVNVSGKPKHSLDVNRDAGNKNKSGDTARTSATVRRLKMYKTRPKRDAKGTILKDDLQSKELPSTRIQPDRRCFGNTRVVNQKELEFFREELQSRLSSNYNVIMKERKLPMSLLNDHQKQARVHLLDTEPFADAFGPKGKRKRPKVVASDYEALAKRADGSQDAFEEKHGDDPVDANADGFRDLVRHTMFEKGQSKRIWGELYKVIDSSDVVIQVLDARDPQDMRNPKFPAEIANQLNSFHQVNVPGSKEPQLWDDILKFFKKDIEVLRFEITSMIMRDMVVTTPYKDLETVYVETSIYMFSSHLYWALWDLIQGANSL